MKVIEIDLKTCANKSRFSTARSQTTYWTRQMLGQNTFVMLKNCKVFQDLIWRLQERERSDAILTDTY